MLSEGKFEPPSNNEFFDINKSLTVRESNENIFKQVNEVRCKSFNRVTSERCINSEIVEDEPHSEQNENLVENLDESDDNKP